MTLRSIGEIEADVIAILARQLLLPVTDVDPRARIDDLGLDSLGKVEAIFALEEHFEISIPFNANEGGPPEFDFSTANAIAHGVAGLLVEQTG